MTSDGFVSGLKIIDSDSHYSEPYSLWTDRTPARYRDKVPQVKVDASGNLHWVLGENHLQLAGGLSFIDRAGSKHPFSLDGTIKSLEWEDIHAASYDARARVKLLDGLGIWAQIVYPNIMGFATPALIQSLDSDLSYQIVATYNDAVAEWAAEGDGRLFPQAVLPFWNIEQSVAEAVRVKELGLTGVTMAGEPHLGGLPDLGQPDWDPLYEALSDLKLPINIHIGASNEMNQAPGDLVVNNYSTAWLSLEERAVKPVNSVQIELANSRFITNLVVSDVLLRWPDLKWVSVESGVGWIPYVLERVDYEYREELEGLGPPERPSAFEMFQRNIYACFWFEIAGPTALLEAIGEDNIMWETDFPHPTCLYPDPVQRIAEVLEGLPDSTVRKLLQDNAAKLYGIDVGPEGP